MGAVKLVDALHAHAEDALVEVQRQRTFHKQRLTLICGAESACIPPSRCKDIFWTRRIDGF